MPYVVLMPAYVDRVLGGGAHTMGFMLSAAGVGAVCATAYLAWRSSTLGLAGLIAGASLTAGAALAVFALSGNFWLSAVCMVAVGGGVILTGASANTVLQSIVDDEMRGRVASFYTMAFIGVSPLGALALGAAAEVAGIQAVFAAAGAGCVVAALVFMRRLPRLRAAIAADRPGLPLP
jgi:MFS family permease